MTTQRFHYGVSLWQNTCSGQDCVDYDHDANSIITVTDLVIAADQYTAYLNNLGKPVLLFSDLESAPNSGWHSGEPNRGAAISVWGINLESTRSANYITVNGVDLTTDTDYAAWGATWPTPFFQRVTFWLNDIMPDGAGQISITVKGFESNALPFTIRAGRIFFVTANNPGGTGSFSAPFDMLEAITGESWVNHMAPGDIYYFRDTTPYTQSAAGGKSILWLRDTAPSGNADNPIALLGFPGEKPLFSIPIYDINFHRGFQASNDHTVFSGFIIDSEYFTTALLGDHHRFIGNDLIGLKNFYGAGTGIINVGGNGNTVLGNAIHGGRSGNRLDHALYITNCAPIEGHEVGWNYLHDNDFGRGPLMVVNHQGNRCLPGEILKSHFLFNNVIDCHPQRSRGIGIFDLSYDAGEAEPDPTFVYNNLVINCGTYDPSNAQVGHAPAIYHVNGHARFYNNTLYNTGYTAFSSPANTLKLSSYFKNNIVDMSSSFPGPGGTEYVTADSVSHLSNNLYFGNGDYVACGACVEDHTNVNNQDPLFADPTSLDFSLQEISPAIDAGTTNLLFEFAAPSYAPIIRDWNLIMRSLVYDLGCSEHQDQP